MTSIRRVFTTLSAAALMSAVFGAPMALLLSPTPVYAVDCPSARVEALQVEGSYVLIRLAEQGWHVLEYYGETHPEAEIAQDKLAVALTALTYGRQVVLRYPDGYNCAGTDYTTPSIAVRISR
jgi:hypothetical protein